MALSLCTDEKGHLAQRPGQESQVEPFLAAVSTDSYRDTNPSTPHASEFSSSASGAPHTYPPAAGSASGSAYTSGSGSGRTLSVVNDTSGAVAALSPAQRKAAEARRNSRPQSQSVNYHADSGVRFDAEGKRIEPAASGSGALVLDPPLADVPPEYSEA